MELYFEYEPSVRSVFVLNPRYSTTQSSVDDYFLLNARVSYAISPALEVFAAGENLIDTNYEFRPGYPLPGISGTIGIIIKLGHGSS